MTRMSKVERLRNEITLLQKELDQYCQALRFTDEEVGHIGKRLDAIIKQAVGGKM